MKNEKIVNYKGIGEVIYRKNAGAKNLSIRISRDGIVKVTVPGRASFARAEQFVISREQWIVSKLNTIQRKKDAVFAWKAGDSIHILGGKISLLPGNSDSFERMQIGNDYLLELPLGFHSNGDDWTRKLYEELASIGLLIAKERLPAFLDSCAIRYGFTYSRVGVRRMKTRWGSCSSTDSISLNSSLVFLPERLVEYVCLHELVHTRHRHHGESFWNALIDVLPATRTLRKELRQHEIIA